MIPETSPDCSAGFWERHETVEGEFIHIPVLYREVAGYLALPVEKPARLVDGTVGGGGHSAMLLERCPQLELLGIDRDESALEAAAQRLAFAGKRVTLVRGNYSELESRAREHGWNEVDGVLLDIGVSSPQLDHPERGFSWRADGPLDMRMDRRCEMTASRLLNRTPEEELEKILREYGEVDKSRKLAAAIVSERESRPFATTGQLVELCDRVLGRSKPGRLPAPTLVFQALRIAVNDELGELQRALPAALRLLKSGGRLAVISFHSLEDRIVKNFFRDEASNCSCPPGLPVCICGHRASVEILTRKAVTAQPDELEANRRSAPARLRAARKI